jgi:hypothetical protein
MLRRDTRTHFVAGAGCFVSLGASSLAKSPRTAWFFRASRESESCIGEHTHYLQATKHRKNAHRMGPLAGIRNDAQREVAPSYRTGRSFYCSPRKHAHTHTRTHAHSRCRPLCVCVCVCGDVGLCDGVMSLRWWTVVVGTDPVELTFGSTWV